MDENSGAPLLNGDVPVHRTALMRYPKQQSVHPKVLFFAEVFVLSTFKGTNK